MPVTSKDLIKVIQAAQAAFFRLTEAEEEVVEQRKILASWVDDNSTQSYGYLIKAAKARLADMILEEELLK